MKIIFPLMLCIGFIHAQQISGEVMYAEQGQHQPLVGASVYWQGTEIGTTTDIDGAFVLNWPPEKTPLVVSYVGFETLQIDVVDDKKLHIMMTASQDDTLDEVVVSKRRKAVQKSTYAAANVFTVNSAELLKAACCNLSESFETNPSIDVNISDALTGTKQIQMLGLTSPYLLITEENIPMVRGASQAYGLTFTPGTWIESIQITKGPGSVVNGYESISGQINTELYKPQRNEPLFVNLYGAANGRLEANVHTSKTLNEKWSTGLFVHGNLRNRKNDVNQDGFLDLPLAQQINVLNRWQYTDSEKGFVSFLNVRYMDDTKQVGQLNFNPEKDKNSTTVWGGEINTNRLDTSFKVGYVYPEKPYQSIGFQSSYSSHDQSTYLGLKDYSISHQSLFTNLIFNSILSNTKNKFKTGIQFTSDNYKEGALNVDYARRDRGVGAFFEYNYDNLDKINLLIGLRADSHNNLGNFITSRLHLRYTPWPNNILRFSVGNGRKMANPFAENQAVFLSGRKILLENATTSLYDFDSEKAWNFGLSYTKKFSISGKSGDLTVDYYYTNFSNKLVVDWETKGEVSFYNLSGKSYAKNLQIEFNQALSENANIRFSYKNYQVKTQFKSGLKQQPLQPKNRFFANMDYETSLNDRGQQWRFDATWNWIDQQRLPPSVLYPSSNPYAPSYMLLNAQATYVFSPTFEVYLGGENLGNYQIDKAIAGLEDPFGTDFDTSFVYAPIFGSMVYAGLRFRIN